MAWLLITDIHTQPIYYINVVVVAVVVPAKVALEAATRQRKEIVVGVVVVASIVIIYRLLRIVIVDPEVARDFVVRGHVRAFPISLNEERLPVPRIEASVVLCLPHHIENEVCLEQISAAHAVVEVHSGSWTIEADVPAQRALLGLCLEVTRNLFLKVTDLMEDVGLE